MTFQFTYNNFIPNLFRYGDDSEPATQLTRMLFHILPGGEIQATHAGRNAAAHLSPSVIGELLVCFEQQKRHGQVSRESLSKEMLTILSKHVDGQKARQELLQNVIRAKNAMDALLLREKQSQPIRAKIKTLEGDVIKATKHNIKRIRKAMEKATQEDKEHMEKEIAELEEQTELAKLELEELRDQIVTSLQKKIARKDLKRAEEAVQKEATDRTKLANVIADSLVMYDLSPRNAESTSLFFHAATTILNAFMWYKYDSMASLFGYFRCMEQIGVLETTADRLMETITENPPSDETQVTNNDWSDSEQDETSQHSLATKKGNPSSFQANQFQVRRRMRRWDSRDIANAAIVVTTKPGSSTRPQVIPFSYVTWAAYSEFPDCGETALRNLINQMIYNPDTFQFDVNLLEELKNRFYPRLNLKMIEFYRKHAHPSDATDYTTAQDWIRVASRLNTGAEGEIPVRYRREAEQANIASPLRNLMRAFNALFGVEDRDSDSLPKIIKAINELRPWVLSADSSGIAKDGFGYIRLTAGKARYELHSYKPVHFGFTQSSQDTSRQNFRVFRKLHRYVRQERAEDGKGLSHIALPTLLIPYILQGRRRSSKLTKLSPSLVLYFADLESKTPKEASLAWAKKHEHEDPLLPALLQRIDEYQEPSFLPPSQTEKDSS